jgi:signal transduction histidine kinase
LNAAQIVKDLTDQTEARSSTIALMRLALALFALLFLSFHASGYFTPQADAYDLLLVLYSAYAVAHCLAPNFMFKAVPQESLHWIDLACFAILICLSGGLGSPILAFFFFAILVASFRYGFKEGFKVTLASVAMMALIHFLPVPKEVDIPLFPAIMHKAILLTLGYFIACWGGFLLQQKRQLKLLSEVNCMPDPRLSVEQLMGNSLEHIREYYGADACLAVMKMPDESYVIFKVERDADKPMLLGQMLDEGIAAHLLAVPPQWSICYASGAEWYMPSLPAYKPRASLTEANSNYGEAISELLEVNSFAGVPLRLHGQDIGRLYLTNCNHVLNPSDMSFLQQLVNQITPRIDNIHLLDKIAATATAAMRQKIAIDLHDSTIQPYIGLKLGLEALRRKLSADDAMAGDVDELVNMTTESIAGLRQYIGGLKAQLVEPLVPALLEMAKNYQQRHGIAVEINADTQLKVNERIATEVYQLVAEGLSNIHRHTTAKHADVNIHYLDDQLIVEVVNQDNSKTKFMQFKPRSMTERVTNLGGTVSVNHLAGEKTIVTAEIPIQTKDRRHAAFAQ